MAWRGSAFTLHFLSACLARHHALPCGFCTAPGDILVVGDAFPGKNTRRRGEVRDMRSGPIWPCTGYVGIVAAIMDAALRCA